jgi:hypothetical protein
MTPHAGTSSPTTIGIRDRQPTPAAPFETARAYCGILLSRLYIFLLPPCHALNEPGWSWASDEDATPRPRAKAAAAGRVLEKGPWTGVGLHHAIVLAGGCEGGGTGVGDGERSAAAAPLHRRGIRASPYPLRSADVGPKLVFGSARLGQACLRFFYPNMRKLASVCNIPGWF